MPLKLLLLAVTLCAVVSQLLLRRATHDLGVPAGFTALPRFVGDAVLCPWMYATVGVQILGYMLWLLLVSREKLGVAAADVGAGFYVLLAFSAWMIYGESLSALQWIGILLVSGGVVCIGVG